MAAWYRTGTASIANGAAAVTGITTAWLSQVLPGDAITFNAGAKWYEVLSIGSNTSLTLATNFAETTVVSGPYAIQRRDDRWGATAALAARVSNLLDSLANWTGFASLVSADVADEMQINDVSAATLKKITLADLATGLAQSVLNFFGTTRGQTLYRGASAWAVLPPGVAHQFLKTGGAGADPSWADGPILLGAGSTTNVASLDIVLTPHTAFKGFKITLHGFRPATLAAVPSIRFSTDGGASYVATNSYSHCRAASLENSAGTAFATGSSAVPQIVLGGTMSNAADAGGEFVIFLLNPFVASQKTRVMYKSFYIDEVPRLSSIDGGGFLNAVQDTDAVRILFTAGNIAAGDWRLWGLR